MGACNFGTYGWGKDVNEAYRNAVDAALHEHGHNSYNGTISTTTGVRIVDAPKFGTKAFQKYLDKYYENNENWERDKWGKANAVELTGKALKEYRKREGMQRRKGKAYYFFGIAAS